MNRQLDSFLRALLPYRLLAWVRQAQLRVTENDDYYERAERRVFFYRAIKLLWKDRITGDYAEFGCNGAMTFVLAYYNSQKFLQPDLSRKLWAFDSFQGLPPKQVARDDHPEWNTGSLKTTQDEFIRICTKSGVPRSVFEVVPGFYQDTIGKNAASPAKNVPSDISLAYIDCVMYSSTVSVLEFLSSRLKHGMIIALDDYYCYSPTQAAGERVAVLEFFRSIQDQYCLLPYIQYGYAGMSFILEDRSFLKQDPVVLLSH
jgi:O-methyltransferase